MNDASIALFDELAEGLRARGWFASRALVPREICEALLGQLQEHRSQGLFKKAGIGQGARQQVISEVRGDFIKWIDDESPTEKEQSFLTWLAELEAQLNSRLFLGVSSHEMHYACYPPATGYQKHLDVFQADSRRVLSLVLYLNRDWKPSDGGELSLFSEADPNHLEIKIAPEFAQCAMFLSDKIYHQVEFTNRERFSVTGWLKKPAPMAKTPVF